MEKFKVLRPNATESAFGYGDNTSNYGVVIPHEFLSRLRNAVLIDSHVKQTMQDRPAFISYGSAEHIMLAPLSQAILKGENPVKLFFSMSHTMGGISRLLGLGRSKAGVATINSLFTSLLPSLSSPGVYEYPWTLEEEKEKGRPKPKPKSAYDVYGRFMGAILASPTSRETVFKTVSRPTFKVSPPIDTNLPPDISIIQSMIDSLEIFGLSGRRQPLFGQSGDPVMTMRFAVEDYLTADTNSKESMDSQFAAAIWYLMYAQIVQTPESYDATLPPVPVTPQDGVVASSILSLLGSLTQTAFSAASSPYYVDLLLTIKFLEEAVEFLETGPHNAPDIIAKTRNLFSQAKEKITDIAYAPTVSYANTIVDYMKKLTGARYLLPEFLSSWKGLDDKSLPFSDLNFTPYIDLPPGYRGSVAGLQKVVPFGGLDIPRLLMELQRRASDCVSQAIQYKHIYDTYYSGLAMPRGSVLTHLDSLGTMEPDPRFGELEYPTPTSTYMVPTYIPKYKPSPNGRPVWSLSDYLFKNIFPFGFQITSLTNQIPTQKFAWNTVVRIPSSPSTGADFSCLLIPYNYIDDTTAQNIANDIASVGHYLSGSKHRPLPEIADFFTPIFHALSTGLTPPEAVANALHSMFNIYKMKAGGDGKYSSSNSWARINPTIPFSYGYPAIALSDANDPWTPDNPAQETHIIKSADNNYMIVLHRKLPKPSRLEYIPYTMAGTIRLSIPIRASIYAAARDKALESKPDTALTFYSSLMKELAKQTVTNDLVTVTHWSKTFAYFPHLFVVNRHNDSMSQIVAAKYLSLIQRRTLTTDHTALLASVLTYIEMPVVGFDVSDESEAFATSDVILEINDAAEKLKSKTSVIKKQENMPSVKLPEVEIMNEKTDTPAEQFSKTNEKGETEVQIDENIPHINPEDDKVIIS